MGLRPILDLQALNRALHKLPFKMLMQKRIFGCIRPLDWFEAIHVSILPLHRPFMRFEFEGCAYQYQVLPFGLSLLPRVFTEVPERPLFPWENGVCASSTTSSYLHSLTSNFALGAGIQAWCDHGSLGHQLGSHIQLHNVSGVWTGPQLCCNCAACLALSRLRGCLRSKDILVHTDNTATIAYISWQGGLLSHLCSQNHLMSLRAIHIPGVFNRAADELSRWALPGEWRLHPQMVQLIWGWFGVAYVDLFASPETTHCQWFYYLTEPTLGTDVLAHS